MAKTPKRPRDTNQLAKMVADLATGNATESPQSLSAMAELESGVASKVGAPARRQYYEALQATRDQGDYEG
jgi:hypothetical protein